MTPHQRARDVWQKAWNAFYAGDTKCGGGRAEQASEVIEAALQDEIEACAVIADDHCDTGESGYSTARDISKALRQRKGAR